MEQYLFCMVARWHLARAISSYNLIYPILAALFLKIYRAPVAQMIEHRVVTRDVVSSS